MKLNQVFFIPSEDSIELSNKLEGIYLLDKSDLNVIGSRGREWLVKNRNWDVIASDYLEHMRKTLEFGK